MNRLIACALVVMLSGCAVRNGHADLSGRTQEELDNATTRCDREAALAWNEGGKPFGAVVLGMTVIGIPIAVSSKHSFKRRIWRECMTGRGFQVAKE